MTEDFMDYGNLVVVEYDYVDESGARKRCRREFVSPRGGGNVCDDTGRQVCAGLGYDGEGLVCGADQKLIDLIKQEWLRRT